ncbi:MAG: elongation factor P [Patescibacteria group bacterium]
MLAYNDLKKGVIFTLNGEPYEVMEYAFLRMQQRKPVAKCKLKNLISGKVVEQNFHSSESFEEAEIVREEVKYLYNTKGQFWFCPKDKPADRFMLTEEQVGTSGKFMKPNNMVTALKYGDLILSIKPSIKMDLKITETPSGERGNTAQGGTKAATLETGAVVQVPLFVNSGDIIKVNTETGDYVERVEKSKE